jgi:hypothetical protein
MNELIRGRSKSAHALRPYEIYCASVVYIVTTVNLSVNTHARDCTILDVYSGIKVRTICLLL